MAPEPSLSQVHADLIERFEHDKRLRIVEQEQAAMRTAIAELPRMEARLMVAIESTKPRPVWPAVSACAAVLAVVLVVAAAIYGQ